MKRILIVLAVLILVPVLAFVGMMVSAFRGLEPMRDGVELPGGARLVKDGYVAVYVLPAGDKQVALIDCGNDEQGRAILSDLNHRGLAADAVKAVFLTHGHPVAENRRSLESLWPRLQRDGADVKSLAFGHSGPFSTADALKSFRAND